MKIIEENENYEDDRLIENQSTSGKFKESISNAMFQNLSLKFDNLRTHLT